MPVPTAITDLSTTAASNYPAGTDSPNTLDDVQRAHASFIAGLRDGKGFSNAVTLASAGTTDIGSQSSQFVEISGTTTITSLGTTYNGPRYLRFTGILTLTYNATSLILPGAASITTAAGDTAIAVPNQGLTGWTVYLYQPSAPLNALVTAPTAVVSINGGQLAGLRSRLINAGMAIDQRNAGAAQTFTAAAALAYAVDRWYGYCTGANVTGQRVAGSGTTQYRYQFTGAASVTKIGFAQRIEAANSFDLNGRAVVVGVELANSLLTTVTWSAWYANTADTFGTLAAPTRTSIGTGTLTVTGTATRYYIPITLPAAATTGIEIEFSVGAQVSGTWTIGEAQLVAGSASELWREQRPIGLELTLCQRYYGKSYGQGTVPGTATNVNSFYIQRTSTTALDGFGVRFPVTMRTTPTTVSVYSTNTGAAGNIFDTSGVIDVAATANNIGDAGFAVGWSATLARPYTFHYIANAEL